MWPLPKRFKNYCQSQKSEMRQVSQLRLIGCLTGSILTVSQSNMSTRNQFAEILTKCTLTRDEWHHLLRLFNVMNGSIISRSHFSNQMEESLVMSNRQVQENQDGEKEKRGIAKSRPARNLVALTPNWFSLLPSSGSTLQSSGNSGASCSSWGLEGAVRLVAGPNE